jgi:potassium-transporting ATPase KdpC subunit
MDTTTHDTLDHHGGDLFGWIAFALFSMLVCGMAYPALGVLLGGALFPRQAAGSLIEVDGRVRGSEHVAQAFAGAGYLIGRPSAAKHDPRALAGSNLAPGNPALREAVEERAAAVAAREGVVPGTIPADLLAASGGGIDPHISPASAELQVQRVAAARGIAPDAVRVLIAAHTQQAELGLFGQRRVHVLRVNLALDAAHPLP